MIRVNQFIGMAAMFRGGYQQSVIRHLIHIFPNEWRNESGRELELASADYLEK